MEIILIKGTVKVSNDVIVVWDDFTTLHTILVGSDDGWCETFFTSYFTGDRSCTESSVLDKMMSQS